MSEEATAALTHANERAVATAAASAAVAEMHGRDRGAGAALAECAAERARGAALGQHIVELSGRALHQS